MESPKKKPQDSPTPEAKWEELFQGRVRPESAQLYLADTEL